MEVGKLSCAGASLFSLVHGWLLGFQLLWQRWWTAGVISRSSFLIGFRVLLSFPYKQSHMAWTRPTHSGGKCRKQASHEHASTAQSSSQGPLIMQTQYAKRTGLSNSQNHARTRVAQPIQHAGKAEGA